MAIPIDQKGYVGAGPGLTFVRPVPPLVRRLNLILIILIIILVLITSALYYWLYFKFTPQINSSKQQIQSLNANQKVLQAQQFVVVQGQLKALRTILENHIYGSNFFGFLENITHPRVRFASLDADLNTRKIKLGGEAASFNVLAEQLKILEDNAQIEKFSSSNYRISSKGTVSFNLEIQFKSDVLRK